jgi:hypothetical protein
MERVFFITRGREHQSVKNRIALRASERLPQTRIKNRVPCGRKTPRMAASIKESKK